jgi:hypothetical protein
MLIAEERTALPFTPTQYPGNDAQPAKNVRTLRQRRHARPAAGSPAIEDFADRITRNHPKPETIAAWLRGALLPDWRRCTGPGPILAVCQPRRGLSVADLGAREHGLPPPSQANGAPSYDRYAV